MAVQKKRMTRSKRDKRRGQDTVRTFEMSVDKETGEVHRRHHITEGGYYRGKQIIAPPAVKEDDSEE